MAGLGGTERDDLDEGDILTGSGAATGSAGRVSKACWEVCGVAGLFELHDERVGGE